MKKIILIAMSVSSLMAAHTSTNWYMSMSRGQMFSMKKNHNEMGSVHSIASPTLMQFNLVHHDSGFGVAYISGKTSNGLITYLPGSPGAADYNEYRFKAYMLSYEKSIQPGMSAKLMLGVSNQNYQNIDHDSKFAAAGSIVYHFDFTKTLCAFFEGGYLKQKPFEFSNNYTVEGSGGYITAGISKAI